MFERFTADARQALVLAQGEARRYGHNYIGTEHVLLGLVGIDDEAGLGLFEAVGTSHEAVRGTLEAIFRESGIPSAPSEPAAGAPPFTPRAKKALELSLREALQRGENHIGAEHVLLGILREAEGMASIALARCGVTHAEVTKALPPRAAPGARRPWPLRVGRRFVGGRGEIPPDLAHHLSPAARAVWAAAVVRRGAPGPDPAATPIRTDHLLLAILDDPDSLAGRALAALGVSTESVEGALAGSDVAGTTDDVVEPVDVVIGGETVRIDDPQVREKLVQLLEEQRKKRGE